MSQESSPERGRQGVEDHPLNTAGMTAVQLQMKRVQDIGFIDRHLTNDALYKDKTSKIRENLLKEIERITTILRDCGEE